MAKIKPVDEQSKINDDSLLNASKKIINTTSGGTIAWGVAECGMSVGLLTLSADAVKSACKAFDEGDKKKGWAKTAQAGCGIVAGAAAVVKGIAGIVGGIGIKKMSDTIFDESCYEDTMGEPYKPVN